MQEIAGEGVYKAVEVASTGVSPVARLEAKASAVPGAGRRCGLITSTPPVRARDCWRAFCGREDPAERVQQEAPAQRHRPSSSSLCGETEVTMLCGYSRRSALTHGLWVGVLVCQCSARTVYPHVQAEFDMDTGLMSKSKVGKPIRIGKITVTRWSMLACRTEQYCYMLNSIHEIISYDRSVRANFHNSFRDPPNSSGKKYEGLCITSHVNEYPSRP